jgi:gliding motility-associated-like protein
MFQAAPLSGCAALEVTFTDVSSSNGGSITGVEWIGSATGNGITAVNTFQVPGLYSAGVHVTTQFGCDDDTIITNLIEVFPQAVAGFSVLNESITELSPMIELRDESVNATGWAWSFSDGFVSNMQEPQHTLSDTGLNTIQQIVTTQQGCNDTLEKEIKVEPLQLIWVPNAFSPNGDNKNEYFTATGWNIRGFSLIIFNRWGQRVFETNDLDSGWDGALDGKPAPEDVYTYLITYKDLKDRTQQLRGIFSLIR